MNRNERILVAMEGIVEFLTSTFPDLTPAERNTAQACALVATRAAVRVPFPGEDEVTAEIIRIIAKESAGALSAHC